MIRARSVCKKFGHRSVLEGVSLTVRPGEVVGFVGANGAGKTTTLSILAGCLDYDDGEVEVFGKDIRCLPLQFKGSIGFVPDDPPLYDELTVRESLDFVLRLHGVVKAEQLVELNRVIDQLHLHSVSHRPVGNLSKGLRRRLALGQALVHSPKILLLDEPTDGLDPSQLSSFRELIRDLRSDTAILISSHVLSELEQISDRVVVIDQGKTRFESPIESLIKDDTSSDVIEIDFLGPLQVVSRVVDSDPNITWSRIHDQGDRRWLELRLKKSTSHVDELLVRLASSGCGVQRLVRRERSLEDLFLDIVRY